MNIRIEKNRNNPYLMINKTGLNDERLSFKAVGILCYLMSKPDDWKANISQLEKSHTDGRESVRTGLKELNEIGYAERRYIRNSKGQIIDSEWVIFESPRKIDNEFEGEPESVKPDIRKTRYSGNPTFGKSDTNNKCFKKSIEKEESNTPTRPASISSKNWTPQVIKYQEYNNKASNGAHHVDFIDFHAGTINMIKNINMAVWEKVLKDWVDNSYQFRVITNIINAYEKEIVKVVKEESKKQTHKSYNRKDFMTP